MTTYVIMLRERLSDSAEFEVYAEAARRAREGHPIAPVVGYGQIATLEGPPLDGILINQFPTLEDVA